MELFNLVDAAYRSDLRELNELNFARFRAEMRASFAELRGEMDLRFARVDSRLAEFEARLNRRLFGFWIAQAATTVGLVFGVVALLKR